MKNQIEGKKKKGNTVVDHENIKTNKGRYPQLQGFIMRPILGKKKKDKGAL